MNNKITIHCNITNSKFSVGYKAEYIDPVHHSNFSRFIANQIATLLVKAIDDQRYKSKWKPLSESYQEWKKVKGLSPKIWEATGLLKMSIDYDDVDDIIYVGIDPLLHYDNGQNILQVARWLEYGTKNIPERPLFRPILQYVRGNIKFFYNKFLREGGNNYEVSYHKWSDRILQEFVREHSLRTRRK